MTMLDAAPSFLTAQQQVHAYLFERIISGQFPGGMHLKTEDLAEQLTISRMPIREALRQLSAEGLVVLRPNRGAFVTSLTPTDIREVFEIRAVLEGLACRLAAANRTPADIQMLEKMLLRMKTQKRNPSTWLKQHDEFHDALCAIAGKRRLSQQITLLRNQTRPYLRLYVNTHEDPEVQGLEHTLLVEALRKGGSAKAEAVMRSHVEQNGESIVAFLQKGPDQSSRATGLIRA